MPPTIDAAWEDRASLSASPRQGCREAVEAALAALDNGTQRVAERDGLRRNGRVNQWLKKAVLLSFRLNPNRLMGQRLDGPSAHRPGPWWDKVPTKFDNWTEHRIHARPASAPCPARSSAAAPMSRRTPC